MGNDALKMLVLAAVSITAAFTAGCFPHTDRGAVGPKSTDRWAPNPDHDRRVNIRLSVDKSQVKRGDRIALTLVADQDCYVTLIYVASTGEITQIWPNKATGPNNLVKANAVTQIPGPADKYKYVIDGADGTDRIVAFATTQKGKVLSEKEYLTLKDGAAEQPGRLARFFGYVYDKIILAVHFLLERLADAVPPRVRWGTAHVSIQIGAVSFAPAAEPISGNVYLLAVGAPTGGLAFSTVDAERFAHAIASKLTIPSQNIRKVLGKEATYKGFAMGMRWLAETTRTEDVALIYFSGHGTSIPDQPPLDEEDGRDECFVLYHEKKPRSFVEALTEGYLMTDDTFSMLARKIPARRKILIADACHSGTIHKAVDQTEPILVPKYYPLPDRAGATVPEVLTAKGSMAKSADQDVVIMSACRDDETAYEHRKKQSGVFTYFLLKAVEEGASDLVEAYSIAKVATTEFTTEIEKRTKGHFARQRPQLCDPYGRLKALRFSR